MGEVSRTGFQGKPIHRKEDCRPWEDAGTSSSTLTLRVGHLHSSLCSNSDSPPTCPQVPYFIPDTPTARADLAAQYTTIGRMDQGGSGGCATAWAPMLGQNSEIMLAGPRRPLRGELFLTSSRLQ